MLSRWLSKKIEFSILVDVDFYNSFFLQVATRVAYGTALAKLGHSSQRVISLDGDTKNSTFAQTFKNAHPDRYIECYIAEQNMVGVAMGCGTRGRTIPFASGFACFLSRAYDQIRMGAISMTQTKFCGSHCGVSIGKFFFRNAE